MTVHRAAVLLSALLCCVSCGSDYPTVAEVRGDMERSVVLVVKELGVEPEPTALLLPNCDEYEPGTDGDTLRITQSGMTPPTDLSAALAQVERELSDLGLQPAVPANSSSRPLLLMNADDGAWHLEVRRPPTGELVVSAQSVVDPDSARQDDLPRDLCG